MFFTHGTQADQHVQSNIFGKEEAQADGSARKQESATCEIPSGAFRNIKRTLRRGGLLLVYTYHEEPKLLCPKFCNPNA